MIMKSFLKTTTGILALFYCFETFSKAVAISPDSSDYKQVLISAESGVKACKKNKTQNRINGNCILFQAISHEKSEVYKFVNGIWQPVELQLFDSPVFDGKMSVINIIKFDSKWAYGYTNNKSPGKQLFRLRMSTIHYNYGC
jgi:hypothetical protein